MLLAVMALSASRVAPPGVLEARCQGSRGLTLYLKCQAMSGIISLCWRLRREGRLSSLATHQETVAGSGASCLLFPSDVSTVAFLQEAQPFGAGTHPQKASELGHPNPRCSQPHSTPVMPTHCAKPEKRLA